MSLISRSFLTRAFEFFHVTDNTHAIMNPPHFSWVILPEFWLPLEAKSPQACGVSVVSDLFTNWALGGRKIHSYQLATDWIARRQSCTPGSFIFQFLQNRSLSKADSFVFLYLLSSWMRTSGLEQQPPNYNRIRWPMLPSVQCPMFTILL